ncbi:MAG: TM helix repeat-containing protein [Candidatus Berkelbacteria bacterium Licking1014_2]|uniref:TM helix repeat-containing protein n=1 Tax=Candidatus Berkelbacteria bacterium Licking1014_2 TaxID=2017146 RepID=A0A554LV71_9BACT|nr:MAG: TM helix repeat-containing protein [Candidatus Berkelbacteria bacterium Licking1014_2]
MDWTQAISDSYTIISERITAFIPNLLGAVVILLVGWLVGWALALLVDKVLRALGLKSLLEAAKVEQLWKRAEVDFDTIALISGLVKWIVYIVFFIAATDTLRLTAISDFLTSILDYVPSAVAGGAIMLIGAILATFLAKVVQATIRALNLSFADLSANVTRYAVLIFALLAALAQLGVAEALIRTLFTGIVAMIAIAGGFN